MGGLRIKSTILGVSPLNKYISKQNQIYFSGGGGGGGGVK